jgi:hypothetical protein
MVERTDGQTRRHSASVRQYPRRQDPKLNLDSLIDISLIQELDKEDFLKALYPEGLKR